MFANGEKNRSIAKSRRPARIAALIVPPLFEWKKKRKNIREIARGDYSIKSGVIRSRNRGETKITTSNWPTHIRRE